MSGEVPDKRYTIELMSSADSEEVIVFLRTFFFKVKAGLNILYRKPEKRIIFMW